MTKGEIMKTKQRLISYRQGDVLLVLKLISALPPNAKEVFPELGHGSLVLAHGEATGHAHVIPVEPENRKVRYWDADTERYLQVLEEVTLLHEEHNGVILKQVPEGLYQQAFQVEDYGEEVRRVTD